MWTPIVLQEELTAQITHAWKEIVGEYVTVIFLGDALLTKH
jgi:hypothetical protein